MKKRVSGNLIVIITVLALGAFAMSMLTPILPLYLTSIGIVPSIMGIIISISMAGMVFGEGYWGWFADRADIKIPLIVGTTVSSIIVFCLAFFRNIILIFILFFLWGLSRSAIFGPARGYIGTNISSSQKATFMAIITVILSASRSIGSLPSGFIADTWGFRWVFISSSVTTFVGGLIVIIGLKGIKKSATKKTIPNIQASEERLTFKTKDYFRPFISIGPVTFLQFLGMGLTMSFLPLLCTQVVGISTSKVGILFTISGVVTMIFGIPFGIMADRMGKKALMISGLFISAFAMAGLAFASSFLWLVFLIIFRSLGIAMFNPAALALISDSVPAYRQSTIMGLYGAVFENTGIIAGSTLGGFIWSKWGPEATFLLGAIMCMLGILICFLFTQEKF